MIPQESASVVKAKIDGGSSLVLLDVREPFELAIAAVDGAVHIPMHQIPGRLAELPQDRTIVVLCHHGMRSQSVARFLLDQGFADVRNLAGGIDAWSREVDPSVPIY